MITVNDSTIYIRGCGISCYILLLMPMLLIVTDDVVKQAGSP